MTPNRKIRANYSESKSSKTLLKGFFLALKIFLILLSLSFVEILIFKDIRGTTSHGSQESNLISESSASETENDNVLKKSEKIFITVKDSAGRKVSVPKTPKRIVCLSATSAELIRIFGDMDKIVGITDFIKTRGDIIPEVSHIPSVGAGFMPDLELVARLKPDILITWTDYPGPELEGKLEDLGVSLLRLDLTRPEALDRETLTLADIMGEKAKEKAEEFLSWNRALEETLSGIIRSSGRRKPIVIVEHFTSRLIAGEPSGIHGTVVQAGGEDLGEEFDRGAAIVDEEWVILRNPEIIIKLVMHLDASTRKEPAALEKELKDELLSRNGWEDMRAIKEKKVYVLDADISGGPRNIIGVYTLANHFYPDLIKEDEAKKIKKEFFLKFLKIKID
jgi:iron complex transport system substrate-binding protein